MKLLALYYAGKLAALIFDEQFFDEQPDVNQMTARLLDVDTADENKLTEALKAVGATSEQLPVMRMSDIMRDLRSVPTYLPEQLDKPGGFAVIMRDGVATDISPVDELGPEDDFYGEDPFDPHA